MEAAEEHLLSEKGYSPAPQKVFIKSQSTAIRAAEANKGEDKLKLYG